MREYDKEANGYRLGGDHDGMFLCDDCFILQDEKYETDRKHQPIDHPITCYECEDVCVSPYGT